MQLTFDDHRHDSTHPEQLSIRTSSAISSLGLSLKLLLAGYLPLQGFGILDPPGVGRGEPPLRRQSRRFSKISLGQRTE